MMQEAFLRAEAIKNNSKTILPQNLRFFIIKREFTFEIYKI